MVSGSVIESSRLFRFGTTYVGLGPAAFVVIPLPLVSTGNIDSHNPTPHNHWLGADAWKVYANITSRQMIALSVISKIVVL